MIKLEIKNIKSHNYLYLKEGLKVNAKSIPVLLYGGRIDKLALNEFLGKCTQFDALRLTKLLDYRVAHFHAGFLDREKIDCVQ